VHITLVIHPRKENEEDMLTLSSVFGGGKVGTKQTSAAVTPYIEYCQATQEADNVLILQKGDAYKFIDVKKNRFDGDLGRIPISFRKVGASPTT